MQDSFRKRSFWVALALILLLVGISAGYLIKRERVEPLVTREEVKEVEEVVEEEALLREEAEEARVPVRAVTARVICPTVDIVSPRDKILLIDIDDSNSGKKGYQIRVTVKTDAEEGRPVFLRVNELGTISTAVKKGSAFFREVDLMEGANTLVATVTSESGCLGESRPARVVVDTRAPIIKILSPVDGAIVNKTDLTVTGEARDEGRKVTFVTVNGVRAELKGEGFKAILASQAPGPLEITATAGDMLGMKGTDTIRVNISLDKPFININSPRKGERLSTPSLEVKGDFGNYSHPERVKITVNDRPAEIDLRNSEYSLTLTDLSDGSLKITAIATDGIVIAKAITNIILDTQLPSIRIDTPLDNEIYNIPAIAVRGSVNDPRPGSGIESVTVNGYEATLFEGRFTYTLSDLGPCFLDLEIVAEAMDNAGNLATSETVIVTVDTELPVVNVTYPEKEACLNTPEVEVRGVAAETCSGINWVEVNDIPAVIEGDIFSAVLPGGACIDPLTITAVAADWAGNRNSSEPIYVTVDMEAPEVLIDSPGEGGQMSDFQPVRGTALDACSGAASVRVNNQDATFIPGAGGFTADLRDLDEGSFQLTAEALDRCGNRGNHAIGVTVAHCPWVNINAPNEGQDFTVNDVELTGNFGCFPDPGAVRVTARVGDGNAFPATVRGEDYTVILIGLPQGSQALIVNATDGNREASTVVHIRVDTVPPEIRITAPPANARFESFNLQVPVEGTAADASSGIESVLVNGEAAAGPPFAPGVVGNWRAVLENQPEGRLNIQATATDGVGLSRSDAINIDLEYPPTIIGPCGTGPYCTSGSICYDISGVCCCPGIDGCTPAEEIDFGVPAEGMFGIGSAINFRPGDKITLPINANIGDVILLAWHITLEYDKEVLINPELRFSDSCLPDPFYPLGGNISRTIKFWPDDPRPAVLVTSIASSTEPTGRRNLLNISFTISPDADPGVYPITVEIRTFSAHEGVIENEKGIPTVNDFNLVRNPCSGEVVVVP